MDQSVIFQHTDTLSALNQDLPLAEKLKLVHNSIIQQLPHIVRIAVAVYDPKTDLLKTFIHSSSGAEPLSHYHAKLVETSSLLQIIENGKPRVVNDLQIFTQSKKVHSQRILAQGYAASYTMPMYHKGEFFGFVFFNADQKNVFHEQNLHYLDLFGHLLSLTVMQELAQYRTLQAAVQTACEITHQRDNETGSHLDRMSRYARLIAEELAEQFQFTDEFIEQIFMFSPLHDLGKIAIPDNILLKPGKLDKSEFDIMKTHADKGREMIEGMLVHFGIEKQQNSELLCNIAQYHHEAMDGSGYPRGLKGDAIPIEARIIAVADIFDALTSPRPYKQAWSNAEAFSALEEMAGVTLDPDCVHALLKNLAAITDIQQQFAESCYG